VRARLIRNVLPLVFALVPVLAAVVIGVSLPPPARTFYLAHFTPLDGLMLTLGTSLFVIQVILTYRALQWRGAGFDERPDRWIGNLTQAAEWFPLMGLIGTVGGILATFSTIGGRSQVSPQEIIGLYAPAITATGSGLLMALINILPSWVVTLGRDVIRSLGGQAPTDEERDELADLRPVESVGSARSDTHL
jgi:hypothetical protein